MKNQFEEKLVLGDRDISITFTDFEESVDIEDICKIHYDNLYADVITMPAVLNRLGELRASAESIHLESKVEREIKEASLKKTWRREATNNGGKFTITDEEGVMESVKLTEKSLEENVLLDKGWQILKNNEISNYTMYQKLDSIYWAANAKNSKLNNLLPKVIPEDWEKEIIEGTINGIKIKAYKEKYK